MTFARDLANFADISANNLTFRNFLINGDMNIAQRTTSTASITSGSNYVVDRWKFQVNTQGTWTMSQENDAPTGSGFRRSTKVLCTTADASPAAGDYVLFNQTLEGQNLQSIRKGTSSAQQLTLSFWVKSNKTGTYIVEIRDQDNTRQVCKSYTVDVVDTWERKVLTFPADTTGSLDNDNALSLFPIWWLGAGSNFTSGTLATTWATGTDANKAVGQTNLAAAINNYWQITGVQLEIGSSASPFEFLPYDVNLRQCQRYYWRFGGNSNYQQFYQGVMASTTNARIQIYNPVPMRSGISSVEYSSINVTDGANNFTPSAVAIDQAGVLTSAVNFTITGATQYRVAQLYANNTTSAYIGASAEL